MLLAKISSLGLPYEQQAHTDILFEEAMTTSAIEGEKLNPASVRSSIARKLGLPSAGLPIDRYTDGLIDILLDASKNHSKPLTKKKFFGWHAALFPTGYSGLHKIRVGKWRGPAPMRVVSGKMGREIVHYEAVPYDRVDAEMKLFLQWWHDSKEGMDGTAVPQQRVESQWTECKSAFSGYGSYSQTPKMDKTRRGREDFAQKNKKDSCR
jgi:Fic family protein